MTVNCSCLMRQFFVLSEMCYVFWPDILISYDRAVIKNKYERKAIVIIKFNGLFFFYKASHKCNPSSVPQSYVVVVVTVVEGFLSHAGNLYAGSSKR